MKKSLLDIVLIHHPDDRVSEPYVSAVTRAFEYLRPDKNVSQFSEAEDPWERVQVLCCTTAEDLNRVLTREETPTLYLVLVSDLLVNSADFAAALNKVAELLPKEDQGRRNAICYSYSDTAMQSLPAKLSSRQIRGAAALGENRIRPFRLALQALHRARVVLGLPANSNKLKLFLSHAKVDGVFFAQALKHSIDQVPELECIYDDTDINSGSDWAWKLQDAAANSVMIALRTPAYEQRLACREEFETALLFGVPIVVVDGMSMASVSGPSHLPFAAMPTVRIADGNTHRVLMAALREHMRLLLMQAMADERAVDCGGMDVRVWPRFPCISAMTSQVSSSQYWLIPQSHVFDAELQASRNWLASMNSSLKLEVLELFRPVPS